MAHPGKGDILASGGRTATYAVPSAYVDPQVREDFESLDEGAFRTKYRITPSEYTALKLDPAKLKDLVRFNWKTPEDVIEDDALRAPMKVVDKRPDYSPKPKPVFKGQALGEHVVVLRDDIVDQVGLIKLADSAQEKPLTAVVVSVGAKVAEAIKDELKPGDRVLIPRYAGSEIDVQGGTWTYLHCLDVIVRL
jgi:chaperonin GroES